MKTPNRIRSVISCTLFFSITLLFGFTNNPYLSNQERTLSTSKESLTENPNTGPIHGKYVVGYYAQWSIFARDYNVLDIEADKLTHLMYAFYDAIYDEDTDTATIESLDTYADYDHNESGLHAWDATVKGNIGDLRLLKERYPHLKVIISVGGWTRSQHFPVIAASENARKTFAQSMVDFMNEYTWIDGFDIDWEFPITGGTDGSETINGSAIPAQPHNVNDHKNFVYLLKEMRETFDANNMQEKEVSISMGNNVLNADRQFIGPNNQAKYGMTENISDFCDFVSFFGYDFGGNWYDKTSYNAPLFGGDNTNDPLHNPAGRNQVLSELIDVYLTDVGIPANKLVMGLPFYGKLFENVASTNVVEGLPGLYESAPRENKSACNSPQPPIGTWDAVNCENSGSIEFCDLFQGKALNKHQYLDSNDPTKGSSEAAAEGWVRYWDDVTKVPYLYNAIENKFISYDDAQSIDLKVKHALTQNLAGVMIWELSQDARDNSINSLLKVVESSLQEAPYDIDMHFEDASEQPLEGVEVTLHDSEGLVIETLTSDSQGNVLFVDIAPLKAYSLTYSFNNYSFLPETIIYEPLDFSNDKTENIIGSSSVYTISGTVTENSQLLENTTVTLTTGGEIVNEKISTDGNYSFDALGGLDYVVTANKEYYSFSSQPITSLNSDQLNQEIVATRNSHTISGNIFASSGGLENITVTLTSSNQAATVTTTDSSGNYSFENLIAGHDYLVTPSSNSIIFNPVNQRALMLNEDKILNFQENSALIYGTVKNGTEPVARAVVSLILPWTDANHGYQNILKTTNSSGEYFYTETDLHGYSTILNLKLEDYDNDNVIYYPTEISNIAITSEPQEFNFNSKLVLPVITINNPLSNSLSIAYGSSVDLESLIELNYDDGATTISSVVFKIGEDIIPNIKDGSTYTGSWSPQDSDYGVIRSFVVEAESSNGEMVTETFDFTLNCIGANCPNVPPSIVWSSPSKATINQNQGFENIPIEVVATDYDGDVTSVNISIDGESPHSMTAEESNSYTYNFMPNAHKKYALEITAVDDLGDTSTLHHEITVISKSFVPLPDKVNVGYYHSWESTHAPFIYLEEILDTKYNVVVYSFIETENSDGFTPLLTMNKIAANYKTDGVFDEEKLLADINRLRDNGIPVLVSIGGKTVMLNLIQLIRRKYLWKELLLF